MRQQAAALQTAERLWFPTILEDSGAGRHNPPILAYAVPWPSPRRIGSAAKIISSLLELAL
jgi:hypothetical protein